MIASAAASIASAAAFLSSAEGAAVEEASPAFFIGRPSAPRSMHAGGKRVGGVVNRVVVVRTRVRRCMLVFLLRLECVLCWKDNKEQSTQKIEVAT